MRHSILFSLASIGLFESTAALPPIARDLEVSNSTATNSTTSGNSTTCATGVHIIIARGSLEQQGPGVMGITANQVVNGVPGSDVDPVVYPATLDNYQSSEQAGVRAIRTMMLDYISKCPNSKIALMGYSQGAQVVGDMLCGTSSPNFNTTEALPSEQTKNIVAIVQYGDPTHVPGLPQNIGNSTRPGVLPRKDNAACAYLASRTQSYCFADDKFCDNGTSIPVHLSYVPVAGESASRFVIQKVLGGEAGASNGTSSSSNSTSPSSPGSNSTSPYSPTGTGSSGPAASASASASGPETPKSSSAASKAVLGRRGLMLYVSLGMGVGVPLL